MGFRGGFSRGKLRAIERYPGVPEKISRDEKPVIKESSQQELTLPDDFKIADIPGPIAQINSIETIYAKDKDGQEAEKKEKYEQGKLQYLKWRMYLQAKGFVLHSRYWIQNSVARNVRRGFGAGGVPAHMMRDARDRTAKGYESDQEGGFVISSMKDHYVVLFNPVLGRTELYYDLSAVEKDESGKNSFDTDRINDAANQTNLEWPHKIKSEAVAKNIDLAATSTQEFLMILARLGYPYFIQFSRIAKTGHEQLNLLVEPESRVDVERVLTEFKIQKASKAKA